MKNNVRKALQIVTIIIICSLPFIIIFFTWRYGLLVKANFRFNKQHFENIVQFMIDYTEEKETSVTYFNDSFKLSGVHDYNRDEFAEAYPDMIEDIKQINTIGFTAIFAYQDIVIFRFAPAYYIVYSPDRSEPVHDIVALAVDNDAKCSVCIADKWYYVTSLPK